MWPTESYPKQKTKMNCGGRACFQVCRPCGHLNGEFLWYPGVGLQWVADGYIEIIDHCCQEKAVCSFRSAEKVPLCHAFKEGNYPVFRKEILYCLGGNGTRTARIHQGKVTLKHWVHWCVRMMLSVYQCHSTKFSHNDDRTDGLEHQKRKGLHRWEIWKASEDKPVVKGWLSPVMSTFIVCWDRNYLYIRQRGSLGVVDENCYVWNAWSVGCYSTAQGTVYNWLTLVYNLKWRTL